MKKALSLFLALVLTVAVMCGLAMAADKPAESADSANAAVKVVTAAGNVSYFDALNTALVEWAVEQEGGATITLLKNLTSSAVVNFPNTWDASNPIVLDLNGYSMTSNANAAFFDVKGNADLTIKNGWLIQNGGAPVMFMNSSAAANNDGAGNYWNPTITLDGVFAYNSNTAALACIIFTTDVKATLNVNNSVCWTEHSDFRATFRFDASIQKVYFNFSNSICGGNTSDRVICVVGGTADTVIMTADKATFVNSTASAGYGRVINTTNFTINGKTATNNFASGTTGTQNPGKFAGTLPNGTAITGSTTFFGTSEPTEIPTPYNVYYDANGGTNAPAATTSTVGNDATVSGAGSMTKAGFAFAGWNTKADGTGTDYAEGDTVSQGMFLYAQWDVAVPSQVSAADAAVQATANGQTYYFAALNDEVAFWAAMSEGTVTLTLLKDIALTAPVTFPADWNAENPVVLDLNTYSLTSDATSAMILVSGWGDLTIKNGSVIHNAVAPTLQLGIDGQQTDANGNYYEPVLTIEKAFVYDAVYANNSTTAGIIRVFTTGANITVNDSTVWSKAGTEFRGFIECAANLASGAAGVNSTNRTTYIRVNNSIMGGNIGRVVRHNGAANTGRVDIITNNATFVFKAYDLNAGNPLGLLGNSGFMFVNSKQYSNKTATYPDVTGSQLNESWSGMLPDGTAVSGAAVYFGTEITQTVVPFAVTYDANGGTGSVEKQVSTDGTAIVIAPATGLSRDGYVFAGWNTAANGEGTSYSVGDSVAKGMTLYAQWSVDVSANAPAQSDAATATFKVTFLGDSSKVFYYDALNSEVLAWIVTIPGGAEIKLQKDASLTAKITFPKMSAENPVVLDLGGYILTNANDATGIVLNGNADFTIKNGIYLQTGAAQNFMVAERGADNNDGNGNYYTATLNFENVYVRNTNTADSATIVESKYAFVNFNFTNALVWADHTNFRAGFNLENHAVSIVKATGSVIGGMNADRVFRISQIATLPTAQLPAGQTNYNLDITATDSYFVSGDGTINSGTRTKINGFQWGATEVGLDSMVSNAGATAVNGFTFTAPNGDVLTNTKASSFGTAPTAINYPYTVVYNANGGSNAPATQTYTNGATTIATGDGMIKDGHVFTGWNTAADGNGTNYAPGTSQYGNLTLFAQWAVDAASGAPEQCDPADAVYKITADGNSFYYAALTEEVMNWVVAIPGGAEIDMLKDVTVTSPITFPANWNADNAIVFDLNGWTLKSTTANAIILVSGNGNLTVKNGYIYQTGAFATIQLGINGTTGPSAGVYYVPTVVLSNMFVHSTANGATMAAIQVYATGADITLNNSTVWATHGTEFRGVIEAAASLASGAAGANTTNRTTYIRLNKSIIGGVVGRPIRLNGGNGRVELLTTDSTIVTNKYALSGNYPGALMGNANFQFVNGKQYGTTTCHYDKISADDSNIHLNKSWSGMLPDGTAVTGVATYFGEELTQTTVPFTVNYDANGGEGSIDAQVSADGKPVNLASGTGLSKAGFTFGGWNTAANGSGTPYAAGASVSKNITLYAQWIEDPASGAPAQDAAATATYKISFISDASKVFYYNNLTEEVLTWAFGVPDGVEIDLLKNLTVTSPITFPASWDAVNPVIFDLNGYTINSTTANAIILVGGNAKLTIKNGYVKQTGAYAAIQLGVSGAQSGTNGYYLPNVVLSNMFVHTTANGGTMAAIQVYTTGADITLNNTTVWATHGVEFRGVIETASNLASGTTAQRTTYIRLNKSIIGGAVGRVIRKNSDSGRVELLTTDSTIITSKHVVDGSNSNYPGALIGQGYLQFVNGTQYGQTAFYPNVAGSQQNLTWSGKLPDGTAVSGIATYFGAELTQTTVPFTVSYDANGATGSAPAKQESDGTTAITVAGGDGLTFTGKIFAGWNTKADGSGTTYMPGASVTGSSVTLYAQWIADPAANAPTQDDAATATYKLSFLTDSSKVFYYNTLSSEVINWAISIPGGMEITLLKDAALTATVSFPADWNAANPIVLNLNGFTMTNGAANVMFLIPGYGHLTVKNGTVINNQAIDMFRLGVSGTYKDPSGNFYKPTLNLTKVFLYDTQSATGGTQTILTAYLNAGYINVADSILYAEAASNAYRGVFELNLPVGSAGNEMNMTFTNSVIFSKGLRAMRGDNYGTSIITATNSAFVTGGYASGQGQIIGGKSGTIATINGIAVTMAEAIASDAKLSGIATYGSYACTLPNGIAANSNYASVFGTAPTVFAIPFRVDYNANGATEGSAPAGVYSENGASVTISGAGELVKEGFIFAGWNTLANGEGTSYAPGDVVTSSVTLYAKWVEKPSVVAPEQVDASEAGIVVELVDGTKYYFATITSEVVNWASYQPGGVTITVLKNLTLAESVVFPADWNKDNAIVIDLDGNTIQNSVDADMFIVSGNSDLTIKNGYLINEKAANIIALGTSGNFKDASGNFYLPALTLEKMMLLTSASGTGFAAINSYMAQSNVHINDSTVWAKGAVNYQGAIRIEVSTSGYNNEFYTNNSIIGGAVTRVFRYDGTGNTGRLRIYPTNTAFVTRGSGDMGSDRAGLISSAGFTWINGVQTTSGAIAPNVAGSTLVNPWNGKLSDGTAVTGAASVFGTAPTQTTVPYTVIYNANGATGSTPADVYSTTGVPVTVGNANNLFLNGHYFVGWNTASDGSGFWYLAGKTISSNATLYAQWRAIPNTVPEAEAGIKVTTITGDTYYYATLDSDIAEWAVNQAGGVTITFLKDLVAESADTGTSVLFPIYWDENVPVVIDFAGHKFTSGHDYMIATRGDANLTLKNGYLYFTGINNLISLGRTGGDRNIIGEAVNPTLNLVNMVCYNANSSTSSTGTVIGVKFYNSTINVENSTLWGLNPGSFYSAINYELGNASYTTYLTATDSIIGGTANRSIRATGGVYELTITNTAFVSTTGTVITGSGTAKLTSGGTVLDNILGKIGDAAGGVANESWTGKLFNGTAINGYATVYGEAPTTTQITTAVAQVGGELYYNLADAIAAANGGTVKLLADCFGPALVIDASVTIDFAGFTYTVTTPAATTHAVEVTGASTVVTLKSGAIAVADANAAYYDVLVMNNGATLTITDMDLDGTNLDKNVGTAGHYSYVLSNEGGTVAINGATSIIANDEGNAFALDVCGTGNVTINVSGTIDGTIYVASTAKLQVSGGTFTESLSNKWAAEGKVPATNTDGTHTVKAASAKAYGNSLALEDWVYVNHYAKFDGFDSAYVEANGGLLVWTSKVTNGEANIKNVEIKKAGLKAAGNYGYGAQTNGIPAAEYANTLYMRAYLKLEDGSYIYSDLTAYSVRQYCENKLVSSNNAKLRDLCGAMLHFGAAAQIEFNKNVDNLANSNITSSQAAWNGNLLDDLKAINSGIVATGDITSAGKSLSLNDYIFANFYFNWTGAETITGAEMLVWDNVDGMLTTENVSYRTGMILADGKYAAQSHGFNSTEYGKTIFVCAHFVDANGADHYSEVIAYSPEAYAANKIDANTNENLVKLCKSMVQYGEFAKAYFGK